MTKFLVGFQEIFFLKKATLRRVEKRLIWFFVGVFGSVYFLGYSAAHGWISKDVGLIIFAAIVFLGFWPLTQLKCPKCGMRLLIMNLGALLMETSTGNLRCSKCGKKIR